MNWARDHVIDCRKLQAPLFRHLNIDIGTENFLMLAALGQQIS